MLFVPIQPKFWHRLPLPTCSSKKPICFALGIAGYFARFRGVLLAELLGIEGIAAAAA